MFKKKSQFRKDFSFEKRKSECDRIMLKYKDRIPIIVEMSDGSSGLNLVKNKYLVPSDLNVNQMLFVIRKRIKLAPEKALFMLFNNTLPPTSDMISTLYEKNKDKDGFLYATISEESTFG
jgi:GABA(A) receptor-associated protein